MHSTKIAFFLPPLVNELAYKDLKGKAFSKMRYNITTNPSILENNCKRDVMSHH